MLTLDPGEGREPIADFDVINAELAKFDPELAKRPQIVALTKGDLPDVKEAYPKLAKKLKKRGIELRLVSAATGEGVRELLFALYALVKAPAE
jgi:GTP-binding protein